jgi:outer membrane protein OmpA-like peptidoglycan-associated protein
MITSVSGEFFVYETETEPTREELKDFFKDLGQNDILEVRVAGHVFVFELGCS